MMGKQGQVMCIVISKTDGAIHGIRGGDVLEMRTYNRIEKTPR